jgi:hypothetical protein
VKTAVQHILKLRHQLHLVYQQVVWLGVLYLFLDKSKARVRITQFSVGTVLKLYLDDMRWTHTTLQQMTFEELEQKVRFTAPSYSCHNLHPLVSLMGYQPSQISFTTYFHNLRV